MPSYTIANANVDRNVIREIYQRVKTTYTNEDWTELDLIFDIANQNTDRFPGINLSGQQSPQNYMERWVKGYVDATHNRPSQRTATPKTACTDPAVKVIVKATQNMTEAEAANGELNHNLFMSAENIQGNLLEEYISEKIRPYGFCWCAGNVLRAIDFCNSDGSFLLQVKNKNNTENSSSSNIREGTTIEKWYRLGTRTRKGEKIPDYKWNVLNELINRYKTVDEGLPACDMSENDYQAFLCRVATANRNLITNR